MNDFKCSVWSLVSIVIGEDGLISYMRCGGGGGGDGREEGRGRTRALFVMCFLPCACVAWSVLSPRLQKVRTDKRQVEL